MIKTTLLTYLTLKKSVSYTVLFFGMIIEGDILLFTAGFLTREGVFTIPATIIISFLGVLFGDALWYKAGALLKSRIGWLERWVHKIAKPFDSHLEKRPFRTILVSKFMYGLHHAILMRAGMLHVPFQKFVRIDIFSSAVWIVVVGGLGYFSSASFTQNSHGLRSIELKLLIGIVAFFIISELISKTITKKMR